MNNEEKILIMLEQMQNGISGLQQGQRATNARLDKVDARLDKVDARLDKVDARLDAMQKDIKDLQSDMEAVKEKVEFTAIVLEGTLKIVDELDQKWNAM